MKRLATFFRSRLFLLVLLLPVLGRATPLITEFLASNVGGLPDEDGDSPDWIEVFNPDPQAVPLEGWFLTDSPDQLTRWRFPVVTLASNERRLVFASGKDRTNPAKPLHANFTLAAGGGYLALVRPDGTTIASEYHYGKQRRNASFGRGRLVEPQPLVAVGAQARVWVPVDDSLGSDWTGGAEPFDDSTWTAGPTGLGFDDSTTSAGLLAYWDFNDAANPARALDRSGANHQGVLTTAQYTADAAGHTQQPGDRAMDFAGTGSMQVPDAMRAMFASAVAHDEITLSFWVNGGAAQPSQDVVFWAGSQTDGGGTRSLGAHLPWSDSVIYWDTGCCDPGRQRISVQVSDSTNWKGRWNHYAFLKRGPTKQIWLNGALLIEGTSTDALNPIRSFFVGSANGGGAPYHGQIDDMAVWDVALDAQQIGMLAAGTSPLGIRRLTPLIATDLGTAMRGVNASAYVRIPFHVDSPPAGDLLLLRVKYDDGFIAYVNGTEIARRNAPESAGFEATALAPRPADAAFQLEEIEIPAAGLIRAGDNVLAIQVLNSTVDDPELLMAPELWTATSLSGRFFPNPTPGAANDAGVSGFAGDTHFEPKRGLYAAPLDVRIWTDTPDEFVIYTINGTVPSLTNGTRLTGADATVRVAGTTVLRAAAFHDDFAPGNVDTQTYLFPAGVASQKRPKSVGATWPGGAPADFAIDARVVSNPRAGYEFTNSLQSIPIISIVAPEPDLFGPDGIYANSLQHGEAWERAGSVEWFYPDGRPGFHEDVGVRIHGGISRDKSFSPKHGFDLVFRGRYGAPTLDVPLFPDTPARGFNLVVLRACSTDSWAAIEPGIGADGVAPWLRKDAAYIRDQWVRDAQIATGQLSSHGTYAHLFLNGIYWGLYNPCERPDADFAALHLGGAADEYDVVADGGDLHAGNLTAWNQLLTMVDADLSNNANYQRLFGNFADGRRNPAAPVFLDVTNLVDYILLHVFIGATDWPNHNWWAARRRGTNSAGFKFFAWDQEISINSLKREHCFPGPLFAEADVPGSPAHMYLRCRLNAEFRQFFADRIQKHLFNGGALTPSNNITRWAARTAEIDKAIVAESARWGDYQRPAQPYRREVEWLANDRWMRNTYFPSNQAVALKRFRAANLFPKLDAPVFSQFGGVLPDDFTLTVTNPNLTGTIYYTVDGGDPRRPGGTVGTTAQIYVAPFSLAKRTQVRARIKDGATWSALVEAEFIAPQDFAALQFTELHYHPPGVATVDGDQFEFVELQNTGDTRLDLSGVQFTSGVEFAFADGTEVEPGAYVVLAADATQFAARYPGVSIQGVYAGRLANSGETLALGHRLGFAITSVSYRDGVPWPPGADGLGLSLQRLDLSRPADDPASWVAALPTPGAALDPNTADSDGDGVPDWWEKAVGTDPMVADAADDSDGDGVSNLDEYLAGTDPHDATSKLHFDSVALDAATGEVRLTFNAASDRRYEIQSRTGLGGGAWGTIRTIDATATPRTVTVTDAPLSAVVFYRLVVGM